MTSPEPAGALEPAMASIDDIRGAFPALDRRHRGYPVAYFDGPGGTQVPRQVVEAMTEYLLHHNANTHWVYPTSVETDRLIEYARQALADFLNARPAEISFGANMTTITFHLARGLARNWIAGDEVVVSELDHHANIDPWRALARDKGIVVRTVVMRAKDGALDWTDFERALTPRTRLVAIGAASNALGTINDTARACALAHAGGALAFVDAVHYAPHALVDVRAFDCDFLACSAYKFYGPHIGVLYGREDRLAAVDLPKVEPAADTGPERIETGTQNHEGIVGAAAAVDFLAGLGHGATRRAALERVFASLHVAGSALVRTMWTELSTMPGVTLYGVPPGVARTPTVAFTIAGQTADQVAQALADRGVFVSSGDFYATSAIRKLGLEGSGVVRAGCACYTSENEVERLLDAVRTLTRR